MTLDEVKQVGEVISRFQRGELVCAIVGTAIVGITAFMITVEALVYFKVIMVDRLDPRPSAGKICTLEI